MRRTTYILVIAFMVSIMASNALAQSSFLSGQKKYSRVRNAIKEKEQIVKVKLKEQGLSLKDLNILIVSYKAESEFDIYVKKKSEKTYKKLVTYAVCEKSGVLGPKRMQGDYQVPEGFYYIDRYNPSSSYYLSLGLNYPNKSDKLKSKAKKLGGDIFIHGECVTIGCLPMTNDKIKEIYLYAINARNNGQKKVPVYVFPFKMSNENLMAYSTRYSNDKELIKFWKNIKVGHDKFLADKKEVRFSVSKTGDYVFK